MEQTKLTGYPSVDRPWLKYYSEEAINAPLPECKVYENIWQHNKDHPNDIALEYYGCKTTYRKLFCEVERAAKALRQAGVQKGDCVALCMAGVSEAVYLVLACSRIGAIANFVNPMFTAGQMIDRIRDTEADLLIVLDAMHPFIADAMDKICVKRVIVVPATGSLPTPVRALARLKKKPDKGLLAAMRKDDRYLPWKAFVKAGERYIESVDAPYEKDRPVVMVYSSGTTGASKGIQLTNDGINAMIWQYRALVFMSYPKASVLSIVPIWFSTGISISVLVPLAFGIRLILEPIFSKEAFAADIKQYKPNHIIGATSLWVHAINYAGWKDIDLSFVIDPSTGGEQTLPSTEEAINDFLREHGCTKTLIKGWGMCELGATIAVTDEGREKLGSVGMPLFDTAVAAFDPETDEELPYHERGELRVVSPCCMLGYYKNPQATAAFFRTGKDGQVWGCTGDIGYMDEDGNVFILGRASDHFLTADGEKFYLFDVENVILQEEAVELCEVVAVGDKGRTPVAHIVPTAGACVDEAALARRLDGLCRAKLPGYAVPAAYRFCSGFPVKPSGKRDTEALATLREGFFNADGQRIRIE